MAAALADAPPPEYDDGDMGLDDDDLDGEFALGAPLLTNKQQKQQKQQPASASSPSTANQRRPSRQPSSASTAPVPAASSSTSSARPSVASVKASQRASASSPSTAPSPPSSSPPPAGPAPASPPPSGPETFSWAGFGQMSDIQQENAALLQKLDLKDAQIERLREALADARLQAQTAANGGSSAEALSPQNATASRVRQLAKKNRELTALLEAERARAAKLRQEQETHQQQLQAVEHSLAKLRRREARRKAAAAGSVDGGDGGGERPGTSMSSATAATTATAATAAEAAKLHEYRSEVSALRKELQQAHRALEKELGEQVPVARVLAGDSSWRGRAEQISMLKGKLAELQAQLAGNSSVVSGMTSLTSTTSRRGSARIDQRHRNTIRKLEQARMSSLEEVSAELEETKRKLSGSRRKTEALKARTTTLERDLKATKEHVVALKEQSQEADALIAGLKKQLHRTASAATRCGTASTCDISTTISSVRSLRQAAYGQDDAQLRQLTVENQRLQELCQLQQAKLKAAEERQQQPHAPPPPRGGGGGGGGGGVVPRPPSINQVQEQALRQAAEVERDRLFELTETLKDRLAHANARMSELQAGKHSVGGGGGAGGGAGAGESGLAMSTSISRSPVNAARHIQSLEARVALQADEIAALKETLEETIHDKESEVALLHSMMTETRRIFSEAMRTLKRAEHPGSGSAGRRTSRTSSGSSASSRPSSRR